MVKAKLIYLLIILILLTACSQSFNSGVNNSEQTVVLKDSDQQNSTIEEPEQNINEQQAALSDDASKENNNNSSNLVETLPSEPENTVTEPEDYDYVLIFPSDRYPETALHIYGAIEQGYSDVCTIDRDGAEENRKESLNGIPTMEGFDRDEWPMAMCQEGGKGASVAYISASDNRGAGSWVGNELSQYEDGERILFIVEKPTKLFPSNIDTTDKVENNLEPVQSSPEANEVVYNSCKEAREAGAAPIKLGEPGYSKKLDRDGDGIACES